MQLHDLQAIHPVMVREYQRAQDHFDTFPLTRRSEQGDDYQAAFRTLQLLQDAAEAVHYLIEGEEPPIYTFYVYEHSSGYDYGRLDFEEMYNRLWMGLEAIH